MYRTERQPGAPDRRREVTASPNQATPRCELISFCNEMRKTLQVLRTRACLQATEKGVPRTIEGEGEGAPIAAAARCCIPPLLLLLPAACAHCWRMTATIARRCHLVWVLHVHVSRSADLCRSTAGAATCGQPAPVMHGLHARTRTRNTRSLYSQLMSGRGTPAKPCALSRRCPLCSEY